MEKFEIILSQNETHLLFKVHIVMKDIKSFFTVHSLFLKRNAEGWHDIFSFSPKKDLKTKEELLSFINQTTNIWRNGDHSINSEFSWKDSNTLVFKHNIIGLNYALILPEELKALVLACFCEAAELIIV